MYILGTISSLSKVQNFSRFLSEHFDHRTACAGTGHPAEAPHVVNIPRFADPRLRCCQLWPYKVRYPLQSMPASHRSNSTAPGSTTSQGAVRRSTHAVLAVGYGRSQDGQLYWLVKNRYVLHMSGSG